MVEAADVVIEVLDARDPLSCRCVDVERFIRRAGASKKIILLLNKIGALCQCRAAEYTACSSPEATSWPSHFSCPRARCAASAIRTSLS